MMSCPASLVRLAPLAQDGAVSLAAADVISLPRLCVALVPVVLVLAIMIRWQAGVATSIYALARMLVQLLLIGFVLHSIFESQQLWTVLLTLIVMASAAGWISLRVATQCRRQLVRYALIAIVCGGGLTLAVVTQGVLQLSPWYLPQKLIPLAGMIFSNCMTAVSLAVDRLTVELRGGQRWPVARQAAFRASLIPITNSLFAVGLVAIPGMMTGQVLSGVDPAVAARYQIMVMCMAFGSAGLSSALFLQLAGEHNLRQLTAEHDPQAEKRAG